MNVCDNLGDHLVGNVYVKFKREEDAEKVRIGDTYHIFNFILIVILPITLKIKV